MQRDGGELHQRAPRQDIGPLAAGKIGQDQFDPLTIGLTDAGLDQQRRGEIHRDAPLGKSRRRKFRRLLQNLPENIGRRHSKALQDALQGYSYCIAVALTQCLA